MGTPLHTLVVDPGLGIVVYGYSPFPPLYLTG